jgi:hypothetical protein
MVTSVPFFMRSEDIGHKKGTKSQEHQNRKKADEQNARRAEINLAERSIV